MRRAKTVCLLIGLITAPAFGRYDGVEAKVRIDAKVICAPRWANDFSMQATCVEVMIDGWRSYQRISQEFSGNRPMERALLNCIDRWTEDGRTDFSMAGTCARMQKEGWERLNK